jgi:hypothetical protein
MLGGKQLPLMVHTNSMSTDGSSQSLTAGQKRKLRDRERLILRPKGAPAKSWAQLLKRGTAVASPG